MSSCVHPGQSTILQIQLMAMQSATQRGIEKKPLKSVTQSVQSILEQSQSVVRQQQQPLSFKHHQLYLQRDQPTQQPNIPLHLQLTAQLGSSVETQQHKRPRVESNDLLIKQETQSPQLDVQANMPRLLQKHQQPLGTVPDVSNIPWMHNVQQIEEEVQQPQVVHDQGIVLMQNQSEKNQLKKSQQHIMVPFKLHPDQLQKPLMQQIPQSSASMLLQQNNVGQQKQCTQAQWGLQEASSSTLLDFIAQTGHPCAGDWQEHLYLMVKSLKDQYFAELSQLCAKISIKIQYVDSHVPIQKPTDEYEKMKYFKLFLEHVLQFLQITKDKIQPSLRENLPIYERQIIHILNSQRKPLPAGGQQQVRQSAGEDHSSYISQQQQAAQATVDFNAQTGHQCAVDWQEDLYQMIKNLKDQYFEEISDLCSKVSMKLQHVDSHTPPQNRTGQYGRMKDFKSILERVLCFLQTNKGSIKPSFREKIPKYEGHIISILNSQRKPWPTRGKKQLRQSAGQAPNSNITRQELADQASVYCPSQTGHSVASDWQDELYQMIKSMKDQYFAEISYLSTKISKKIQNVDRYTPTQIGTDNYRRMKDFKSMLERVLHFLQIKKGSIQPSFRAKIPKYERQIISILDSQKRKPVQTQGPHWSDWCAPSSST